MNNLLQSIRGLVGFVLFLIALFMTFDGFPGALLSWLGGGVVAMGYHVAISTITHEDVGNGKEGALPRFARICLAFAIASLGAAMIGWGGLYSISVAETFRIPFRETGILIGIATGLFNIDKDGLTPGQIRKKEG